MNKILYKRFEDCIPVKGYQRSLLCDLTRGRHHFLPNDLANILQKNIIRKEEYTQLEYAEDYFDFLIENEFIFKTTEQELGLYPPMSLEWDYASKISNAVLEIGQEKTYDISKVLDQVMNLGCRFFTIIFDYATDIDELAEIAEKFEYSSVYTVEFICKYNYVFFRDNLNVYRLEAGLMSDYFINRDKLSKKDILKIEKQFDKANKETEAFTIADAPEELHSICLVVTRDCNLRCRYCYAYEDAFNNQKMSFNMAKKAIDFLLNNSPDVENYGVVFFGGEPLLEFDLMKRVVAYCKKEIIEKKGKGVGYALTTNGTLLNDEIAAFFKKEQFNVQISMDGVKSEHDKNRVFPDGKGSYECTLKSLHFLKKHQVPFMIHSTFTPNIDFFEAVSELESLKISYGYGLSIDVKDASKEITSFEKIDIEHLRNGYQKIVDLYYDKLKNDEKVYCQNIMNTLVKVKDRVGKEYGCTAGDTMISVLPDGEILSCQNFQKMNEYYEGNIENFNLDHVKIKAHHVDDSETCNECWIKYLCGGGCFYEKCLENKSVFKPSKSKCEVLKIQTEYFLKLYVRLEEENLIDKLEESFDTHYELFI